MAINTWHVFIVLRMVGAPVHYIELIRQAREAEGSNDLGNAATLYEKAIKQKPFLEQPYTRLMIIYRKLKQPQDELRIINTALDLFTSHYDERIKHYSGKDKIGQVSKALLRSLAGSSKPAKEYPQPIPKWTNRQKQVEKKTSKLK